MRGPAPPVWRDSNFNKIWIGEIVSSLSVSLASSLGVLNIRQLYLVAFAAGCVSVVADVAFQAILVGRSVGL